MFENQTEVFKLIKRNRTIKNKNNDHSVSLRLYRLRDKTFKNGSLYIPKQKESYLRFVENLKPKTPLTVTYRISRNKHFRENNIDIVHIETIKNKNV